jgi:hypothetical protein
VIFGGYLTLPSPNGAFISTMISLFGEGVNGEGAAPPLASALACGRKRGKKLLQYLFAILRYNFGGQAKEGDGRRNSNP